MSKEEKFETYAYFWVADFDCEPTELTEKIGLEPSRVLVRGEPLKNEQTRQRSFWELHSTLPRSEVFQDAHIKNIVEVLLPKVNSIRDIGQRYPIGISCVGYYKNVNPGFHMTAELIQQCAMLGVCIDFDLYNSSEPRKNA